MVEEAARQTFDYLFSIVNFQMLADDIVRLPRKGAVNFHDSPLPARFCFNVSHLGQLAFLGFARSREIRVDLEVLRPIPEAAKIAEHFFWPCERRQLHALPMADRSIGSLNCWTRKEAYLKALGDGLARPLREFDVSLTPGEPARLLRVAGDASEPSRWFLQSLTPAPGHLAAVAVLGDR